MPILTVYESSELMTKKLGLKDNQLQKDVTPTMHSGRAKTLDIPDLRSLMELLKKVTHNQAVGYGIFHDCPSAASPPVNVTTRDWVHHAQKIEPKKKFVARSREHMRWPDGPGFMLLDIDPDPAMRDELLKDLRDHSNIGNVIRQAIPELANVSLYWTASTSSHIYNGDHCLTGAGGYHVYLVVERASEIPRIGSIFAKRLWLRGFGFIKVSRDGKLLERQLIDHYVWQPERIDFCAGAKCTDTLEQRSPAPRIDIATTGNGILESGNVSELTTAEQKQYERLIQAAKSAQYATAKEKRTKYTIRKSLELVQTGIGLKLALNIVKQRMSCGPNGDIELHIDDLLRFDRKGVVSVRQVLADRHTYHLQTLSDPLDPEKGPGKAKLYVNDNGSVLINSFVHGERVFSLHNAGYKESRTDNSQLNIRIIDKPCGSGKTTGVLAELMKLRQAGAGDNRFLIVVPELSEIQRYRDHLGQDWLYEPEANQKLGVRKIDSLIDLLQQGHQVVTTHALFSQIRRFQHLLGSYHVLIDETPTAVEQVPVEFGPAIFRHLLHHKQYIQIDPVTQLISATDAWLVDRADYEVKGDRHVRDFMDRVQSGEVYWVEDNYCVMPIPDAVFTMPRSLTILTFLFEGTQLHHWMLKRGFKFQLFSDPNELERFQYQMNKNIYLRKTSCPVKAGFANMTGKDPEYRKRASTWTKNQIQRLRKFDNTTCGEALINRSLVASHKPAWFGQDANTKNDVTTPTCLSRLARLSGAEYTSMTTRGTNKFKARDILWILGKENLHPSLAKFLGMTSKRAKDRHTLSELVQLIYRTAIRDGYPIYLFTPDPDNIRILKDFLTRVHKGTTM